VFLTEGGVRAYSERIHDTGDILTTYDFEAADINTYFVSAAKVLVHDCGGQKKLSTSQARSGVGIS